MRQVLYLSAQARFKVLCMYYTVGARVCVCARMCVQPWFPQQMQLSGALDCVCATVTLFQDPELSERSDKEAQESSQSRRRGCRVKGVKGRRPQSDTHASHTQSTTDRVAGERQRARLSERLKACGFISGCTNTF